MRITAASNKSWWMKGHMVWRHADEYRREGALTDYPDWFTVCFWLGKTTDETITDGANSPEGQNPARLKKRRGYVLLVHHPGTIPQLRTFMKILDIE